MFHQIILCRLLECIIERGVRECFSVSLGSLRGRLAERSVPVSVWNSTMGGWEPIDFRNGQRVVEWPHGFSPQLLPIPEYQEGDRVQFIRDETCARDGTVRLVLFQGDISPTGCATRSLFGKRETSQQSISSWNQNGQKRCLLQ